MLDWGPMPEASHDLLAVYVDGETKTGKGAAGGAITAALRAEEAHVYYDVAGDFYRRYVAWVRLELGLADDDALPVGAVLEETARRLYESGKAFERDDRRLGDLQRPAISESVSKLGELPLVQQAGIDWWAETLVRAREEAADVVVLDGRNPRLKVAEAQKRTHIAVRIALDLYMTCEAAEAGRRVLRGRGVAEPSAGQLATATREVVARRDRDRNRPVHPFVAPSPVLDYDPAAMSADTAIKTSWEPQGPAELPVAVRLDNTHLTELQMLAAVRSLAVAAVHFAE